MKFTNFNKKSDTLIKGKLKFMRDGIVDINVVHTMTNNISMNSVHKIISF